jgi:phosphate transport system ATP-binding protein
MTTVTLEKEMVETPPQGPPPMEAEPAKKPAPSGELKLQIRSLDAWFGKKQALFGINLDIKPREVTAMIGPSGCGKSTLLRCLNRMHETVPGTGVKGEVIYDGQQILGDAVDAVAVRRRIGMVFQKPTPFPTLSIFENVAAGMRLHGERDSKKIQRTVESTLRRAALWDEVKDVIHKPGSSLSGGQQQRLCIARALAIETDVLLLDEPCSALDPISTAKIEELLFELKSSYTIVIVTHNMQQASRVSEKTLFMLSGKVIEFGDTNQVFTAPAQKLTEDYITGRFG